jgi:hypothetical protein
MGPSGFWCLLMPYILTELREQFTNMLTEYDNLLEYEDISAGELNYLIFSLCNGYWANNGQSYQKINDIMGVLESVKQEFYRRIAINYEDDKMKLNGDVI